MGVTSRWFALNYVISFLPDPSHGCTKSALNAFTPFDKAC